MSSKARNRTGLTQQCENRRTQVQPPPPQTEPQLVAVPSITPDTGEDESLHPRNPDVPPFGEFTVYSETGERERRIVRYDRSKDSQREKELAASFERLRASERDEGLTISSDAKKRIARICNPNDY